MPEETQTILNKIAVEYKNLLLPVYHYMDLYDKDITRLIQFLNKIQLRHLNHIGV